MSKLKELRKEAHMSQSELASILGVNPISIWNWENDVYPIKKYRVKQLIQILGGTDEDYKKED